MGLIDQVKSASRLNRIQIQFLCVFLAYLGSVVLFFHADVSEIHTAWTTPKDLEYGYLVFALALVLMVRNAKHMDQSKPLYWPMMALALIALVYWVGSVLEVRTFRHLSLFLGFPCFTMIVLGRKAWDVTWVPCCVVIMALPAGYLVLPYLQQFTIQAVTFLIRLTSMTAYIEGAYIHVPEGVIWVKEGCSGHKYFITAATLALLVAAYDQRPLYRALPILGVALFLSVAANWIRVFILVLVGYFSGMEHPLMDDHDNLGWVVFMVMMVPFFYLSSKGKGIAGTVNNGARPSLFEPNTSEPVGRKEEKFPVVSLNRRFLIMVCGLFVVVSPKLVEMLRTDNVGGGTSVTLLSNLNDGEKVVNRSRQWFPNYAGATKEYHGSYRYQDQGIDLSLLLYRTQAQGKELDNTENTVFASEKWRIKLTRTSTLEDYSGAPIPASIVYAGRGGAAGPLWVVVYWHYVNGVNVMPGLKSKLLSLTKIWDYKSDDMLVALATVCHPNCELAEERLGAFIKAEQFYSITPYSKLK